MAELEQNTRLTNDIINKIANEPIYNNNFEYPTRCNGRPCLYEILLFMTFHNYPQYLMKVKWEDYCQYFKNWYIMTTYDGTNLIYGYIWLISCNSVYISELGTDRYNKTYCMNQLQNTYVYISFYLPKRHWYVMNSNQHKLLEVLESEHIIIEFDNLKQTIDSCNIDENNAYFLIFIG